MHPPFIVLPISFKLLFLVDMPAARDNAVADSGIHETVSNQPYEIAEPISPVLCCDNLQSDDIVYLPESMPLICDVTLNSLHLHPLIIRVAREVRMSVNDHKPHVNGNIVNYGHTRTPVLLPRVLTRSERNFTRLRIWLAYHAYKSFGCVGVSRFGPRSVLKFTAVTRVAEAANIEYIGHNTTIPVPRIQDVFIIGRRTYIVMDYIDGSELTYAAKALSQEQYQGICSQLKGYIAQMRALKAPKSGRLEAADGSGLFDIRLSSDSFPPFTSVEEFHVRLGHEFVLKSSNHSHMWSHFELISQRKYKTIFTHSDIAPRNILIKDGKIAAIIDWETAGWYPEYWEYTRWAVSNYNSLRMWRDLRDDVLDPYPDELKVDEYLGTVFTRL